MIRTLKTTFFLLALSVASCGREKPENGTVYFGIAPTIVETGTGEIAQAAATRSKVSGTFPSGAAIGLRVTAPSAVPAISSVYNNFFGMYNGATWFYYLDNINAGDRLSGFPSWGTINVYGYYPYNAAVTDLTAIPFRIATLNGGVAEGTDATVATDHMVAGPRTKNMSTATPPGDLSLEFGHAMTAIEFVVNRSISSVPYLTLNDVTFQISGGSPAREFTVSGTYDAINPNMANLGSGITAGDRASSMVVSYPSAPGLNSGSVTRMLLVIMPELRQTGTADDATVTMTFRFRDQDNNPYVFEDFTGGNPVVTFKLSDIANTGNDNGLLAGWSYSITATLGAYTKFVAPATGTPTPPHVNYYTLVDDPDNQFVDI